MSLKPRFADLLWMTAGAAILLVVVLLVLHFNKEPDPTEQLAFRARRLEMIAQMRLSLASASEAEKSAVIAVTDSDSQTYADQAHAATANVEHGRKDLEELLNAGGTQKEKDTLARFATAFVEFQRIDSELLALAVKNTNLKASVMTFGPAADALKDMQADLSRVIAKTATDSSARDVALLAFGAEIGALHIQALLAPHIAEESDAKMGELEAQMATHDQEIRKAFEGLTAIAGLANDSDVAAAAANYTRFNELRARILALSHENTNVRSIAISLDQKRAIARTCQNALDALQQAILDEPIPGVSVAFPVRAR
jgi:hypothetical protein